MHLYPAIDIKNGKCVRLRQGSFAEVKSYSDSPADVAELFERCGAGFLHLVDLDGALQGESVNLDVIKRIRKAVHIPIEVGGGIRSREAAEKLLNAGITRVIVGTKAAADPGFMKELIRSFGADAAVAGIDARSGLVAVEGWEKTSECRASELALRLKAEGVRHIIYTDISRDGMMTGPNVSATKELTKLTGLDVIASGGVSSMDDLENLYRAGISGVIIGKALYEGKVDLKEAEKKYEMSGR